MAMNIILYGPRVLLEKEKPLERGVLLLPDSPHSIHSLARVVKVGDGRIRQPDGSYKTVPIRVNVGDIVFFQTNALLASACSYEIEGKNYLVLLQDDLLARFPDLSLDVDKMEMLGDWTLVEPFIRQPKNILLPETLNYQEHLEHTFWKFLKAAADSDLEVEPGQEVIVNAHRANPVQLSGKVYCYLDRDCLLAVVDSVEEPVLADAPNGQTATASGP